MPVQVWTSALEQSFSNITWGLVSYLPSLVSALIIFILGWFAGELLGRVVEEIIHSLKVDRALRAAGFDEVVSRAGYSLNSGKFVGALIKWFIVAVFLLASLSALGLSQVTAFLQTVVLGYVPSVIVSALIILLAAVLADVLRNVVVGAARAAGIKAAGLAGTVVYAAVWTFAVLAALLQLGIAESLIQTLFTGVVVAFSLSFGLAFGLGGQQAAAEAIESVRKQLHDRAR